MAFQVDSVSQLTAAYKLGSQGDVFVRFDLDTNAIVSLEFNDGVNWRPCTYLLGAVGVIAAGNDTYIFWDNPSADLDNTDGTVQVRLVKTVV